MYNFLHSKLVVNPDVGGHLLDFVEAERKYSELKDALIAGKVTPEQFTEYATQLRLQTPDGAWWQVDPESGGWRKWDGAQWLKAVPPGRPEAPSKVPQIPPSITPAAEPVLGTEEKKPTPKYVQVIIWVCMRLVFMVLSFALAWFLHTYLLAWVNDGVSKWDKPIWRWVSVIGNEGSSFTIWFIISSLFWSIVWGCIQVGPVKTIVSLVSSPFRIFVTLWRSKLTGVGALLFGLGLAMIASMAIKLNTQANVSTFISWTFLSAGLPGLLVASGIERATCFITRKRPGTGTFTVGAAQVLVFSIAIGFLFNSLITVQAARIAIAVILILAGLAVWVEPWRWIRGKPSMPVGEAAVFLFVGSVLALIYAVIDTLLGHPAHAHDGGYIEFKSGVPDGTPADWLRDPSSRTVIDESNRIASGSAIGALAPPIAGDATTHTTSETVPPSQRTLTQEEIIQLMQSGTLTMEQMQQIANSLQSGVLNNIYNTGPMPEGIAIAGSPMLSEYWKTYEKANEGLRANQPLTDSEKMDLATKQIQAKAAADGVRWSRAIIAGTLVLYATWEVGPLPAITAFGVVALADYFGADATKSYTETAIGTGTLADKIERWNSSLTFPRSWFGRTPTDQAEWYDLYKEQVRAQNAMGECESDDYKQLDKEIDCIRDVLGEDYITGKFYSGDRP